MSWSRRGAIACAAAGLAALGAFPAQAQSTQPAVRTVEQIQADGSGVAFAVRAIADQGGAAPLSFYIGYSDANVTTPEPAADGQASWYQLGIAETAAFQPPEDCTPEKNAQATIDGISDLEAWASAYIQSVADDLSAGVQPQPPGVPGFRHACTERLPGFAQSRFPATDTIPEKSTDDYLTKPGYAYTCRQDPLSPTCDAYKQFWPSFESATGSTVRDGSFAATATDAPSQRSDGVLMGAGDGSVVSIGLSRTFSSARLEGKKLIVESSESLNHICIMNTLIGCTIEIDSMRQYARITKEPGKKAETAADTIISGVHGLGPALQVTAEQLGLGGLPQQLGDNLLIAAVSKTHSCDTGADNPGEVTVDTGGLVIFGRQANPGPGAGIMIGGACARARIQSEMLTIPSFSPDLGLPGIPGTTIGLPGSSGTGSLGGSKQVLGPPQVITKVVTHVTYRDPIAWRTAKYWAPVLGALALFAMLAYTFRRHPAAAPVVGAVDRFARQFLRG